MPNTEFIDCISHAMLKFVICNSSYRIFSKRGHLVTTYTGLPAFSDTGYSDTVRSVLVTVTLFRRPSTVTVTGEACTNTFPTHTYRVTHLLANLGWVDLDFGCSTLCLVLPGLMGNWQNWQDWLNGRARYKIHRVSDIWSTILSGLS